MPVPCARCNMPLPKWDLANGGTARCTQCGSPNNARLFPAAFERRDAPVHTEAALEGEAACFDHPSKRAVAACSQCGRFLCQLCQVEFGGEVWCPSCVAAGRGKAQPAHRETAITLFDSTALILPLASLLLYPFTIFTAPATIALAILKWRSPLSLVRRSRWRFLAAILIGLAEMAAWGTVIVFLLTGRFETAR